MNSLQSMMEPSKDTEAQKLQADQTTLDYTVWSASGRNGPKADEETITETETEHYGSDEPIHIQYDQRTELTRS